MLHPLGYLPVTVRAGAPIRSIGSASHSRDHTGGRTGSRDLGDVPRRMTFQEGAEAARRLPIK